MTQHLEEVIAFLVLVAAQAWSYWRRRQRGATRWESIRPWPMPRTGKPLPPWATPAAVEYLWDVARGENASIVPPGAEEAHAIIQGKRRSDADLASSLLLELELDRRSQV